MTTTQQESNTQLYGYALWLARAAWSALALFSIGYYILWSIYATQQPLPSCTPASADCNAFYLSVQDLAVIQGSIPPLEWIARSFYVGNVLTSLSFILVALFIVWRKSDDWMALWLSSVIMALGAVGITPDTTEVVPTTSPLYGVATAVAFFGYFAPFATLYFFPDGRFVPRWLRWVCLAFFVPAGIFIFVSDFSSPDLSSPDLSNILTIIFLPALVLSVGVGIGSMVYRYRRFASPQQRQQIKWVAFGLVVAAMGVIVWILFAVFLPPEQPNPTRTIVVAITFPIIMLLEPLLPISVAIAVIRYRLWDIDILIRRTLIYFILTAALAFVYFGSVILLQQLSRALTGQQQSEIVTVISTLAIAALFVPLRNRIQNTIDRRFYRRKYDAARVLSNFGATVRDEVDLNQLSEHLLLTVAETMQPAHVSLWLKPTKSGGNVDL